MVKMQDPDASYRPSVTLDFEERYRARLEEVEEKESTVPTARKGSTYLAYKFSLHDSQGAPVLDDDTGDPYLQWMTCNNSTGYSKPPYIGSREIAEALMGRKLDSDDVRELIDQGWDDALIGKTAQVDLQLFTDEKTGSERIKVVRILPDRRQRTAAPARPAEEAPKSTPNGHRAAPAAEEAPEFIDPPARAESREERRARLLAEAAALDEAEV